MIDYGVTLYYDQAIPYLKEHFESDEIPLIWTIKAHGANMGVSFSNTDTEGTPQSRSRVLGTGDKDHFAFYYSYNSERTGLKKAFKLLRDAIVTYKELTGDYEITVFGEYCGRNIHNSVGLSNIDSRKFLLFAIFVDGKILSHLDLAFLGKLVDKDYDTLASAGVHFIHEFGMGTEVFSLSTEVDTFHDHLRKIVQDIEESCPIAKAFGRDGVGEGIVVSTPDMSIIFKLKGPKHAIGIPKTYTPQRLADLSEIAKIVDMLINESRLEQCIDESNPTKDKEKIYKSIEWMIDDIVKENHEDVVRCGFTMLDLKPQIATKVRNYILC